MVEGSGVDVIVERCIESEGVIVEGGMEGGRCDVGMGCRGWRYDCGSEVSFSIILERENTNCKCWFKSLKI